MKSSIIILIFFLLGITAGYFDWLPGAFYSSDNSIYALYLLMFLVGISVGSDNKAFNAIKKLKIRIIAVPFSIIIGSYIGIIIVYLILSNYKFTDLLAIGSGFGYYSLSSIFITELRGDKLGIIALLTNVFREIITLIAAPLLAKYISKIAPIAVAGATSMDTTLPIITKSSGKEFVIISIFSGIVLTILVPILITLILDTF